jgi:hypothetical protein
MNKITGRVEILVNGQLLLNKKGATAKGLGISGEPAFERKPVFGDTGLHGFVEEAVPAECEVKITDRDDIKLGDLAAINGNGTVIFRAAGGGKSYKMEGATCANNMDLTAGEGETSVKFIGGYWIED